jgi:hypothetical protein
MEKNWNHFPENQEWDQGAHYSHSYST